MHPHERMIGHETTIGHERMIGRLASVVALCFGAAYLGWRITSTLSGVPVWLAITTLVVEIVGFVAVAVYVWAMWHSPQHRRPVSLTDNVGVIIRSAAGDIGALRATVLAASHLGPITIVDPYARPEVAALAAERSTGYVATSPDDRDGLMQAIGDTHAAKVLVLGSGDIPRPDVLDRLLPWFDDPSVAIVQGMVVASLAESSEHGSGGRHDKEFERGALGPMLGTRGLARFCGSGAVIRTAAVRGIDTVTGSAPTVEAEITTALFAAGWRIVAPGGEPVVAVIPIATPNDVESLRACEASAARALLLARCGALRFNSLRPAQRLALIAHAIRPLGGIRRTVIIVLLLAALFSGVAPINADVAGMATLWAPWFVLSSLGMWAMSGGTLRPGDRVRASMRVLGASWRGVMAPNGRPDEARHVLTGAFGVHHGAASAAAIGAIGVVVGLRAFSDRVGHTLARLDPGERAVLLLVALWSLGGGLDALRLLARRTQGRRATRIVASLSATIDERAALVVDLTQLGAGVLGVSDLEVGDRAELDVVLPTVTGCVSATLPVLVRNVRTDFSGERRLGVEFTAVATYEADALAEFCIVQPALEVLGAAIVPATSAPIHQITVLDDRILVSRRIGLRAAALVAVFGALSSSMPTSADAAGPSARVFRGSIAAAAILSDPDTTDTTDTTDSTGPGPESGEGSAGPADPAGAVVTAVCSRNAGIDRVHGTSDDTYGTPVSDVVDSDGAYSLALDGEACWYSVAPPAGHLINPDSSSLESLLTPQVVDLSAASFAPIELTVTAGHAESDPPTEPASTVTIDDVVWADLNGDRSVQTDEPRIAGVTVTVYDVPGAAVATSVTDADGMFSFTGLPEGSYRIGVSNLPDGYVPDPSSANPLGQTNTFDSHAAGDVNLAIGLVGATPPVEQGSDNLTGQQAGPPKAVSTRLLAQPSSAETAPLRSSNSTLPGLVVVLLASIIGFSVVAGSLRPNGSAPARVRHR